MKSTLTSFTLALVAHAAVVVGVPSRRGAELYRRDRASYQPVCYWGSPQSMLFIVNCVRKIVLYSLLKTDSSISI